MDRLIDKYPFKKILYLNWYEAAIGHLLLFKFYIEKYSKNVYFLISEQGIMLKAVNADYLKKVDDEITKFFTAKIEQLELNGSPEFYNNIIEDIKEQTDRLKDARDCPYINLVSSEKLRNSCLAMKKLGYLKPYENWQCHEREKKGFCFLIVRPDHRWKEIAQNVYALARKRESSHPKPTAQLSWPVEMCYEKFIWFYLKKSFKSFKKNLEIRDNKLDKCLTIVIKKDTPEFTDLEKQIESLTFFYRATRPVIKQAGMDLADKKNNKILIFSPLEIQKITELIYHEFGLTSFAKELRKKMTGFLIVSSVDISDYYEDEIEPQALENNQNYLHTVLQSNNPLPHLNPSPTFNIYDKEDINQISTAKLTTIHKLSRKHSIVNYEGMNYIQIKINKPISSNYERILKVRLPCLPKYYYWHDSQKFYYLMRSYYAVNFISAFEKASLFQKMRLLYSAISIVEELHQRGIVVGVAITEYCYVDERRVIIQPEEASTKEEDTHRLKGLIDQCLALLRGHEIKNQIEEVLTEGNEDPFSLLQYLEDYIDSNS